MDKYQSNFSYSIEKNDTKEEVKDANRILQEKRQLEEEFTNEILFNEIAFKTNAPVTSSGVPSTNKTTMSKRRVSPEPHPHKRLKKEKFMAVCEVEFDGILEPNKQLYVPGLGLKRDMGMKIIDVRDIKDVSFWANNVYYNWNYREQATLQFRIWNQLMT